MTYIDWTRHGGMPMLFTLGLVASICCVLCLYVAPCREFLPSWCYSVCESCYAVILAETLLIAVAERGRIYVRKKG